MLNCLYSLFRLKDGLQCVLGHSITIPCFPGLHTGMLLGMTLEFSFRILHADAGALWTRLCDSVGGQSPRESDFKCDIGFLLYLQELLNNQLNVELLGNA